MSKDFTLKSNAFEDGGPIPEKYTCESQNISPQLEWSNVPYDSEALVLIFENFDETAQELENSSLKNEPVIHWIITNLPPDLEELPEGAFLEEFPFASESLNDFNIIDYLGPCPRKPGKSCYKFTLFALDYPITIDGPFTSNWFKEFYKESILGQAELICTYEKK